MGEFQVEVDAGEVGFDAGRLARIDRHFAPYVDEGKLPGWLVAVTRGGKVAHVSMYGRRDVEYGLPVEQDTLFRIYSMTKPVTSVAAMMLYEEGVFELTDPVSKFIPAFADARVYLRGPSINPSTEPLTEPVRMWHLLSHTAGLTYGFHRAHPVDAMYRAAGFDYGVPSGLDLAACCEQYARLPLLFQPGTGWAYSVATDVLGRVVEVASGQALDRFLRERILEPLGMSDTGFQMDEADVSRLAALYNPETHSRRAIRHNSSDAPPVQSPTYLSGGAGLVSTAADYHRFTQMLLRGGELDGVRLLGPRTVAHMATNHLPGGADLDSFGMPLFAEMSFAGVGFGLGFSVMQDPVKGKSLASAGEFAWGGAASTVFWVDPVEDLTAMFFTQLFPSNTYPIRSQLRQLVYQALID